ncbi:MAG: pantetheine-phosphate adenylyltransferase [Flavobacteriales bacterium]
MSERRIAVFPGSFDPITIGHESVIRRGSALFDECVVAVGINAQKDHLFPLEKRMEWLEAVFKDEERIRIDSFRGLTIEYCRAIGAKYILRGLRNPNDFEFERNIAQMNKAMDPAIETVLLPTLPEHTAISSTIVRDIIRNDGDPAPFVPAGVSVEKA